MTDKTKAFIIFLAAIFAIFMYANRCYIVSCPPASWEKILEIAFANSGDYYRIDSISAYPSSHSSNNYTQSGPTFIDINITYVSLEKDNYTNYPTKFLQFDDRDLILRSFTGNSWTNRVPPEDGHEKLKRVTIHPRDVFRMTWTLAEQDSSLSAEKASVSAFLGFNEVAEKFGCESVWFIQYLYDHAVLTYHINAQTGQIISSEKNLH